MHSTTEPPRFHWTTAPSYIQPFGPNTVQVIDEEAHGAIIYTHIDHAEWICEALTGAPRPETRYSIIENNSLVCQFEHLTDAIAYFEGQVQAGREYGERAQHIALTVTATDTVLRTASIAINR